MLFSSYEFILLFLPATVAVYYALGPARRPWALAWLIAASLFFYAWWRPFNVALIGPSILVNYAAVQALLRAGEHRPALSRAVFWAGIAFNLAFLGYFKYRNFALSVAHDLTGAPFVMDTLILPLGISFITFQKIALLVDVHAGRVKQVSLRDYALFVLFFPPLIAGPIVHYRELIPQFAELDGRLRSEDLAVGLTLFFSGLFKKLIFADSIAVLIDPIWSHAASGQAPGMLQAWAAALGYLLQLYFDFSGYSEMAIGAARLFGIKLPYNFDSPYKATSVSEFWTRWHVTLTRFLTAYIFNPLTLSLTRKRAARGLPIVAGRGTTTGAFVAILVYPTMVTMLLAGLWHGAGYQFLIFGALYGAAMVVNHAWRLWKPRGWPVIAGGLVNHLAAWALTLLLVAAVQVFFRAPSLETALAILQGMAGANGVTVPMAVAARVNPMLAPLGLHLTGVWEGANSFVQLWAWIAAGYVVVLALPNILEIMAAWQPALGYKVRKEDQTWLVRALAWRPGMAWALGLSGITAVALLSLGRLSEFLYWRF
jgi:D-alanyl-lipoteichoic acid acyltransferase DltB (MBOAT superfamily)